MKVPFSWLKEFIPTEESPETIGKKLTLIGLEVDAIDPLPLPFEGVVVGFIEETSPHPEADRLTVAKVSDGKETFQVVCGAPNCRKGMKTAFAKIGAVLEGESKEKPFKIKKSKLRGVESFGMLCAPDELGLSDSHDGIMELPEELETGKDLKEIYGDLIFDISLTPNLSHCQAVYGVAREYAAISGLALKGYPRFPIKKNTDQRLPIHIDVASPGLCPRYTGCVLTGIQVGPSPEWLTRKLEAAGVRSINVVVDVTNLVMMELGQPMHAFDYDKLAGQTLKIDTLKASQNMKTLDGQDREIHQGTLCIFDSEKPIAIAGVMGGETTEVSETTTTIVLESAYFNPSHVRKSGKEHHISTESSKRFERGTDPNNPILGLERAVDLICALTGAKVASDPIDICSQTFESKKIPCSIARINALLGTKLAHSEIEAIFHRLGFAFCPEDGKYVVSVPTYRIDLHEEIDLVEEVGRIYGYDNIPYHHARFTPSALNHSPVYLFESKIREKLLGEGLQECLNCDLISPEDAMQLMEGEIALDEMIQVLNPSSVEQSCLRPSLLPGILQALKHNTYHGNSDFWGFEIGKIHLRENGHFKEEETIGIFLTGKRSPTNWSVKGENGDFFDLKGIVENLFEALGMEKVDFAPSKHACFHPGQQAWATFGDSKLGTLGRLHPRIQKMWDLPHPIYFAELSLQELHSCIRSERKMHPLPVFPGMTRDLTLTLSKSTSAKQLLALFETTPSKLLQTVEILDLFESDKLGKNQHNVTLRFFYRDERKTLKQEVVDKEHERVCKDSLKKLELADQTA